jgi:hypothetical protein
MYMRRYSNCRWNAQIEISKITATATWASRILTCTIVTTKKKRNKQALIVGWLKLLYHSFTTSWPSGPHLFERYKFNEPARISVPLLVAKDGSGSKTAAWQFYSRFSSSLLLVGTWYKGNELILGNFGRSQLFITLVV